MALPTNEGRYIARPHEWKIEETGDNRLPTFICRFDLIHFYDGSEWRDVTAEGLSITGYFYLIMKTGKPNQRTIDNLVAALGWDGRSVVVLANEDWSETEVQLTLASETYNNKTNMKVKWINPRDASPTGGELGASDQNFVQSLEAKYGAMLRAGAPAPVAAKPTPAKSPAAPPAQSTAPPANADVAKKDAWKEFCVKWNEHLTTNAADAPNKNQRWSDVVTAHFGPRAAKQELIAGHEWTAFGEAIKSGTKTIVPQTVASLVGDDQKFTDDEIPF